MKKLHSAPSQRREQEGAVLIVALIMLLLVSVVSIASIRTATMDERMAGNARDREKALQAAEAAVRTCLRQVVYEVPPTFTGTVLSPALTGAENWEVPENWAEGATGSIEIEMLDDGLASNPRCMVERLGSADNYRITGRAVGGSETSIVILQATYSAE